MSFRLQIYSKLMRKSIARRIVIFFVFPLLTFMAVLACSSVQTNPSLSKNPINELYIFGDSLSDVGLLSQTNRQSSPGLPYVQGRYSNGPVWVEYLADHLQLSSNQTHYLAYGGATTGGAGSDSFSASNGSALSVLDQVKLVTQRSSQPINPDALAVVWAGANDYLQGNTTPTVPVANIIEAIASLMEAGANRFLVANLPDLGYLPETRNSPYSDALSSLTQNHNQELNRLLSELVQQHVDTHLQIIMLDVYDLYQQAITQPNQFGFSNVTDACLSTNQTICDNPEQFLFWDGIHPTTFAHEVLGDAAFLALEEAGIVE